MRLQTRENAITRHGRDFGRVGPPPLPSKCIFATAEMHLPGMGSIFQSCVLRFFFGGVQHQIADAKILDTKPPQREERPTPNAK